MYCSMTLMSVRVKKSETSRLANNRGQALIEYVLMLIISVSLVLALMSQIFQPFGDFISNYMGKYVQCLLEYGELPSLGSEGVVEEDPECSKRFAPGTLAEGRPPINQNGPGEGGGAGGDGSTNSSAGSDSSSSSGSSRGGGTYAGSASRRGGSSFLRPPRQAAPGIETGEGANQKVVEIALEGQGSGGFFQSQRTQTTYVGPGRRTGYVAVTGLTESERKKLEKKQEGTARIIASDESFAPPPKKMAVKKPEPKVAESEDEPMTIGNFIRIIFIAAIIIALIIFVGGQALQMSKNFEK